MCWQMPDRITYLTHNHQMPDDMPEESEKGGFFGWCLAAGRQGGSRIADDRYLR